MICYVVFRVSVLAVGVGNLLLMGEAFVCSFQQLFKKTEALSFSFLICSFPSIPTPIKKHRRIS